MVRSLWHWACIALSVGSALGATGCRPHERTAAHDALVVLLPRDAEQLDPRLIGDAYGLKVSRLIFASLVTIHPHTLKPIPDLAEKVELVAPAQYRVRLRKNLRFSDGTTLDAADVAATYRSVVSPQIGSRYARTYRRIARMETPDPHTVVFHLTGPHATFLTDLELPILRAEDEYRRLGALGKAAPVGAGPYRLVRRQPGQIELRANPHWHRGTPLFPRVRMLVVRDDNTRALRMLAGAADLALSAIPPLLVPLFADRPEFAVKTASGVGTTYLGINTEASVLADLRVRRAIAHAIDRRAIIETKLGGRAQPARGWIVPGHWAHSTETPVYDYDPDKARALLDAAGLGGHGSGSRLQLTLRTGNDRFRMSIARVLVAMLEKVGIGVDLRPTEVAMLIADLNKGHFELTLLQVPEVIEPHTLSWFFGSDRIPGDGGAEGANRWRIRSAALDAALEQGRRTPERNRRREAYRVVQRILAEQLPVIPLWHEDVVAVMRRRVRGFAVPRDGRFSTLAATHQ